MKENNLPMRTGVGIIVLNSVNKVFVAKRKDNPINKWQMPQGGVDKNESLQNAMRRELIEETSIKTIKIIKEIDRWFEYQLPKQLIGIIWRGKYKGQKQKWFVVKFIGNDKEININTKNPEFIEWKWIDFKELPNVIVDFKKHIYKDLVKELNSIIG
tara:strand:- start:127 stop:597 length:471 start_codon:yes stop_codon:yes gene_type:complete